jgi:hypothetical protein
MVPLNAHGVKIMSLGFIIERDQPAIWRGPIIMKIITQFIRDVQWGELDYFIIDLPPGTGDAQLSLVQATKVAGALIVTTPQEVAIGDALRGAKMFQRVDVPVLGIIENMSWLECTHCGEKTAIFGSGGGARLAAELGVPVLGQIPLYPPVLAGGDTGLPIVVGEPDSAAAVALMETAKGSTETRLIGQEVAMMWVSSLFSWFSWLRCCVQTWLHNRAQFHERHDWHERRSCEKSRRGNHSRAIESRAGRATARICASDVPLDADFERRELARQTFQQLKQLEKLKKDGMITTAEYSAKRTELLRTTDQ